MQETGLYIDSPCFFMYAFLTMANGISGTTTLYGLLGYPAKHSISPLMHNTAFAALSLDCRYLAFEVAPENLTAAVQGLRALGAGGFNLTMPHKKAILPLLDDLSEAAALCGSVNTVVNRDGKLTGHTTDGIGYVHALEEAGFPLKGAQVALLGGGGAAESVLTQLALEDVSRIFVFKRNNATFQRTAAFAEKVSAHTHTPVTVCAMEDTALLQETLQHTHLLINATNVGMAPSEGQSLVPPEALHPGLFVSDLIYHPKKTRLLTDAAEVGCPVMNGLPMLLHQGAEAFRIWTGEKMPIDLVKKAIAQ